MAEPVIELCAVAIKTQLATITVANGYLTEVAEVIRPTRMGGYTPKDKQIVMFQGDRHPPEDGEVEGKSEWVQEFVLSLGLMPTESDTTAADTFVNRFAADVEKALKTNESAWAFSGRVNWWIPEVTLVQLPEIDAATLQLNVHYRTAYGDGFTAG